MTTHKYYKARRIFKMKVFSKSLSLCIVEHRFGRDREEKRYKYHFYRRDGRAVLLSSGWYDDYEKCRIDSLMRGATLQREIQEGTFFHKNLYIVHENHKKHNRKNSNSRDKP